MTKDKALEEIFLAQKPHFDDKADFMARLTKRLDTVEYIRQYQEATLRRYRIAMIMVFVVGIISGAISTVWLLSTPADVPLINFQIQTGIFIWLAENLRVLTAAVLSLLMTIGFISIAINVQDILDMRTSMKRVA